MATIDEANIFAPQDPDTGQTYQLFDADAIKQKQVQSKEQYNLIKEQIKAGNLDQAYEGFTQLPFADQMLLYINPVTGVPLESYEVVKFGAEAQPRLKTFKEFGFDMLDPRKKLFGGVLPSPVTVGDKGSALMSGLAGLGVLGGAFDLANIPKAIISPFVRKAPLYSKQEGTGGGGIGGLSKKEFIQKEINEKARDGLFVSNLNKYLISTAPKNLKGQALLDHIQANKSKGGYKADEIKFSGLETFIKNNPQATTQEAIDYLSTNKLTVKSTRLVDPVSDDSIFMEPKAEPINPLDGTDQSLVRSADILEDLKLGSTHPTIYGEGIFDNLDDIDDPNLDWAGVYYNALSNDRIDRGAYDSLMAKYNEPNFDQLSLDYKLEDLADEMSMKEFYDDPYKLIELDEGVGSTLKAYGNDNVGYALIENGQKIDLERPILTEGEARNQMRLRLENEGALTGDYGSIKYKDYFLDGNMPFVDGYDLEEIPLSMPMLAKRGLQPYFKTHYPDDEYPIGSYAKIETKLEDGRDARYILEFQSDLHQKGAAIGYNTPQKLAEYDDVILPQLADDVEKQAKAILGDDKFNEIKASFGGSDDFYAELNKESKLISRGGNLETYTYYENTKELRDELPDMYPHKEFVPPLVKNVIAKAIEDGVDTIAFPTSIPILERTNTQIADIKSLYLTKVGKASQQERDIIDLDTNIDELELGSYEIAPLGGKNLDQRFVENYFGELEDVVDHLVDLKQMDRQLQKFPNVDFSLPQTRQEYTDFNIDAYRLTKDDPVFDPNLIDQFAREIETDLNNLGFEVVERVNTYDNPKLQRLYDQDYTYNDDFVKKEIEAIAETQPLTARAMKEMGSEDGGGFSSKGAVLYNKAEDKFVHAKDYLYDTRRKIAGQGEIVVYNPLQEITARKIPLTFHASPMSIANSYNFNIANKIKKLDEEGKIPESFNEGFDPAFKQNKEVLSKRFEDLDVYSLDVNKKIGGEKFTTDYDKKLPAEIKRIANEYGGKFEKGSLDAEAVYGSKLDLEGELVHEFMPAKRLEAHILTITPEMAKKIIEEGMPQMYKGGIVRKSQSMDKPIAGNTRYV